MAALRTVLGKLGIKSIYNNRRPIVGHALTVTDSYVHVNDNELLKDRIPKRGQEHEFYMDLRRKQVARFAIEEYNKQKNAQLQFVKVLRFCRRIMTDCMDFVILEAVDSGGAVKVYQAQIGPDYCTGGRSLQSFSLVVEEGRPLPLYDYLDEVGFLCIDLESDSCSSSCNVNLMFSSQVEDNHPFPQLVTHATT